MTIRCFNLLAIIGVNMKFKWKKWYFWDKVKTHAERKMKDAWMDGGNCDSCCPRCKQWESKGNTIETVSNEDGSEQRTCTNCGNEWKAIFTPVGFVQVDC